MKTWGPAQLSKGCRTLVRGGLTVEYAPECIAAADLAATPAMRARLVCPLLPDSSTSATPTAAWIYTGWWPPPRLKRLCAAHPTSRHHCIVYRAQFKEEYSREFGGFTVPTTARTVFDLLAIEEPGIAVECIIHLLRSGLNLEDLLLYNKRERRRRGGPFARKVAKALKTYIEETR